MDDIEIKKEFDHVSLFIKKESAESEDYALMMITQNVIPGLLKCKICYMEEIACYCYDITSLKTLEKEYEDKKIEFIDLRNLFLGLYRIIKSANEFLLEQNGFLLQPQYIFRDLEKEELFCLYLPEKENIQMKKYMERGLYRDLAEFLLDKVDHKDEHAVNMAYQFYKMSKEEFFSFEVFIGLIEKEGVMLQVQERRKKEPEAAASDSVVWENPDKILEDEIVELPEYEKALENESVSWWIPIMLLGFGVLLTGSYLLCSDLQTYALYILVPGLSVSVVSLLLFARNIILIYKNLSESRHMQMDKEVTIEDYFGDVIDEETVYFDDTEFLWFKWKEEGLTKEYELSEFPISVGKLKDRVQILIEDASISRLHASIKEHGNAVFLQDLDSTNGTFVNGRRLASGEEVIIKRNDEIQFGKIVVNVV